MTKRISIILGIFVIGMAGGIFATQILWPYLVERPLFFQYRLEQTPIYVTERKEIKVEENAALEIAVEKTQKMVVAVKTKTKAGEILEGSGLIVTSDGLMVTLASLVPEGSDFSFYIDGKALAYQILKRDIKNNLALAKIAAVGLATPGFVDSDKIKPGKKVFLVGAILSQQKTIDGGGALQVSHIVNTGIIKSLEKNLVQTNIVETLNLQGSPLFDVAGNAVGLSAIDASGRVWAIPASKIREFIGF